MDAGAAETTDESVTEVLLSDGWHKVQRGSFHLDYGTSATIHAMGPAKYAFIELVRTRNEHVLREVVVTVPEGALLACRHS